MKKARGKRCRRLGGGGRYQHYSRTKKRQEPDEVKRRDNSSSSRKSMFRRGREQNGKQIEQAQLADGESDGT